MGGSMAPERGSSVGAIHLPVRRLHVELTNRCNFSCEFCPDGKVRRPRGSMAYPLLERILSDAKGVAVQVHFHIMGEPTLYPHLKEAVQLARDQGLAPSVTTNGSHLSSDTAKDLFAAGL